MSSINIGDIEKLNNMFPRRILFGAFLSEPITNKHNERGSGNGLRYAVASMQGWRSEMEDAHCAITSLSGDRHDWSFFGVFDGHLGKRISKHCAMHLPKTIMETKEFQNSNTLKGIHSGFLSLDEQMRQLPEVANGEDFSGSTAVCAVISPEKMFLANCGDARAVLCSRDLPAFGTQDHKPYLDTERERIYRAGGVVFNNRVNGNLAVSRALGDYEFKRVQGKESFEQPVSPEPDVYVKTRNNEKDEFLILACDGVWDVMSTEDVCSFVRSRLAISDDLEAISNQVIDTCFYKGSTDNISVMLVTFPAAPLPSAEAIQQESQLESTIESRIKHIISTSRENGTDEQPKKFGDVMWSLQNEEIPGLPPGGGLHAKTHFIENIYRKLCPDLTDSVMELIHCCTMTAHLIGEFRRTAEKSLFFPKIYFEIGYNVSKYMKIS